MTTSAKSLKDAPAPPAAKPSHRVWLLAAILLGLTLLALSALIHAAAAATLGAGWSSLGFVWLVAIAIALLAIRRARTVAAACRRMCFVNGVASLGLLTVGVTDLPGLTSSPDIVPPPGPVFGFVVAAGILVIAGVILAAVFFAAWHLLSRHRFGSERHA